MRDGQGFLIYGHRGSPRLQKENTLASFEEALRGGADGFETDLRLLQDGTTILFHDDEVRGKAVESLTAADLARRGYRVQPLRDLAGFVGRARMVLEVKRGGWEQRLIEEVGAWSDIVVASFDHAMIGELARRKAPFPLGITFSAVLADLPAYARRLGASWCYPDFRRVDAALVASLHDAGIAVVPWTVNRRRDWDRMRQTGCDGIITDVPAKAVAWRDGAA
ncbi:MAG TPA: glycerophosphodiester phosphodiesterase [Thermoanaerobaculia bacterium]|nr:glycerophosphodiester phosphodiesterase [Thermoanaerobaculia bacterium]